MTPGHPTRIGLRLRRDGGRVVITRTSESPTQRSSRRALYLFLSRGIPAAVGTNAADSRRARAESGLLIDPASGGSQERVVAVTTRHPCLEDAGEAIAWTEPPSRAAGSEALVLPLLADLLDLASRMSLGENTPVAVHCGGLPGPLIAGPLGLHGARAIPTDSAGTTPRPERRHLLYRPDATEIAEYLSGVADGSLIAIYSPGAGECTYDFYPHVHRRGLQLVHGAAGEGRPLSNAERRMARGALQEAPLPIVRIAAGEGIGEPKELELPPETGAFILEIDV